MGEQVGHIPTWNKKYKTLSTELQKECSKSYNKKKKCSPPPPLLLSRTNSGCGRLFKQITISFTTRKCMFRPWKIEFEITFPSHRTKIWWKNVWIWKVICQTSKAWLPQPRQLRAPRRCTVELFRWLPAWHNYLRIGIEHRCNWIEQFECTIKSGNKLKRIQLSFLTNARSLTQELNTGVTGHHGGGAADFEVFDNG